MTIQNNIHCANGNGRRRQMIFKERGLERNEGGDRDGDDAFEDAPPSRNPELEL